MIGPFFGAVGFLWGYLIAGKRGGKLVAQGSVKDITDAQDSQTGKYLLHAMKHPLQARRTMPTFNESSKANEKANADE